VCFHFHFLCCRVAEHFAVNVILTKKREGKGEEVSN
jgi:hypothetical protein